MAMTKRSLIGLFYLAVVLAVLLATPLTGHACCVCGGPDCRLTQACADTDTPDACGQRCADAGTDGKGCEVTRYMRDRTCKQGCAGATRQPARSVTRGGGR